MDNIFTLPYSQLPYNMQSTSVKVDFMEKLQNIASTLATSLKSDVVFTHLINNRTFIAEAKEARKRVAKNSSRFTNLTQKYSDWIT